MDVGLYSLKACAERPRGVSAFILYIILARSVRMSRRRVPPGRMGCSMPVAAVLCFKELAMVMVQLAHSHSVHFQIQF